MSSKEKQVIVEGVNQFENGPQHKNNDSEEEETLKEYVNESRGSFESFSDDENYDDDSDASYIYNSQDNAELSSEATTDDEKDYFGDSSISDDSEESSVAWEDSDENLEIKADYQNSASWLTSDGLVGITRKKTKRISFRLQKKIFSTKYKVKLFKIFESFSVAIDNFNIVYIIQDFKDFKAYKIDRFIISDFIHFNGGILLSSNKSSYLKLLTLDGKVTDINKRTGVIKKMIVKNGDLYVVGDKLYKFNKKMNLKNVFNCNFIDLCVNSSSLACLKENGDIFTFNHNLVFKKKYSISGKFQFKGVYCTETNYFIAQETGFIILNEFFTVVKELNNLKMPATSLTHNNDFIIYGSDYQNSLRILKDNLEVYDKFPFSKVRIDPINYLILNDDSLYICHSRFISLLKISYVAG